MASGKTLIPIITENTSIGIIRINASIPVVSFTKAEIVYTTKVFIIANKYTKKIYVKNLLLFLLQFLLWRYPFKKKNNGNNVTSTQNEKST